MISKLALDQLTLLDCSVSFKKLEQFQSLTSTRFSSVSERIVHVQQILVVFFFRPECQAIRFLPPSDAELKEDYPQQQKCLLRLKSPLILIC